MKRTFRVLEQIIDEGATGILTFHDGQGEDGTAINMRREGAYLNVSAHVGALEIALRVNSQEFQRSFRLLHPVEGLQTTLHAGAGQTDQAEIRLGLRTDGSLILRPLLIGDASGYVAINLLIPSPGREVLAAWLER